MDSYVVRIYRRAGRKPRILIGTAESAGTGKKMAFTNIEELWEILMRRTSRDLSDPPNPRRRIRKEVMSGTAETVLEEPQEGVLPIKPASGP
jgi:hypothetical protein